MKLTIDNYEFLRKHIARATELAQRCADQDIARSLREMAAESQRVLDALIRTAERRDEFK